jgi:hypothetical protein
MEGVRTMMPRLAAINNVLPFPLTVNAPQHIMELLDPELLQGPLEDLLSLPHPVFLLHLLEEVRGVKP